MPSQVITSVENNFTKGLVTEYTGLNFPENAATDCDNVEFTIIGEVSRRLGIGKETNGTLTALSISGAFNSFKWDNAGGDGSSQFVVQQIGQNLYFYDVDASTVLSPLSNNKISATIDFSSFAATGGTFSADHACEFTTGNGYLFVFHPDCDPFYCTYESGTILANTITISIRDLVGIAESVDANNRPSALTTSHSYNLQNQGWTSGTPWVATSVTGLSTGLGAKTWTVQAGLTGVSIGQAVVVYAISYNWDGSYTVPARLNGTVSAYGGTSMTISVTSIVGVSGYYVNWNIVPSDLGYITTWNTAIGNYPSNSDQWWRFKNTSDVYAPLTTVPNVTLGLGEAPKGHFILNAFNQTRSSSSNLSGITDVTTTARPTNGCWFQGRIWYTGVNASFAATGTASFTTWTENIYFSQIVQSTSDFGKCYQTNDPTSELLFDLLPTDGGIITIQGSGPIYKLFPIQNGMLIFAANGIWFLTGSQGIGFAANDYTLTKISNIKSISTTSFVDVMGLPYFWNEEGIYQVQPANNGGLNVEPITVGTILSYYSAIPLEAKKFARGAYDPIEYVLQWIHKDSDSTSTADKYTFNKILHYNVYNKAFFPHTVDTTAGSMKSLVYVSGPGGLNTPESRVKYFATIGSNTTFADANNTSYLDWDTVEKEAYFVTGYKLHGQAQRRFQIPYLYMYSDTNGSEHQYKIQSRWDYSTSGNSGRWSSQQVAYLDSAYQNVVFKRHRLRGHGLALQFKVTSVAGQPFNIIGWSVYEVQNTSI